LRVIYAHKLSDEEGALTKFVMAGPVPATHVGQMPHLLEAKTCCCSTWVAGTSPAMTVM
jgi:hypothetical protein